MTVHYYCLCLCGALRAPAVQQSRLVSCGLCLLLFELECSYSQAAFVLLCEWQSCTVFVTELRKESRMRLHEC